MKEPHTHLQNHMTRIIKRGSRHEGISAEWLQYICLDDGIIFREIKVVDEAKDIG